MNDVREVAASRLRLGVLSIVLRLAEVPEALDLARVAYEGRERDSNGDVRV